MEISITLGSWILPLILTIAIPIVAYIEDRGLGDYGVPLMTMLNVVAAIIAWVMWGLSKLIG